MNYSATQKAAKRKIYDTYAQTCVAAAQKKRDYVSNHVTLPGSCAALDVPPPAGVDSATITDNGATYTISVTASDVGFTFNQDVAKQVSSP